MKNHIQQAATSGVRASWPAVPPRIAHCRPQRVVVDVPARGGRRRPESPGLAAPHLRPTTLEGTPIPVTRSERDVVAMLEPPDAGRHDRNREEEEEEQQQQHGERGRHWGGGRGGVWALPWRLQRVGEGEEYKKRWWRWWRGESDGKRGVLKRLVRTGQE